MAFIATNTSVKELAELDIYFKPVKPMNMLKRMGYFFEFAKVADSFFFVACCKYSVVV